MMIDKSWIREKSRLSSKFLEGLNNFMKIAEKHVNSEGKVRCPCKKCVNMYRQLLPTVYAHIHDCGFLESYTTWDHHGEKHAASDLGYNSTPRINTPVNTPHTSAHGSMSYAERRHIEEEQGQKPQHIKGWRQMRFKDGVGWCTPRATEDWEKIQEEYRKMQEEVAEGEDVNELQCLTRALGERRGHTRGVGRKPKSNKGLLPNQRASTSSQSQSQSQPQNMSNTQFVALTQQMQQYLQQIQKGYNDSLAAALPNFQPPPMPQFQFTPDMFQTNTPEQTDDTEEEQESDDD